MAISAVDRIAQLEAELERCKEGYIAAVMKAAYLEGKYLMNLTSSHSSANPHS